LTLNSMEGQTAAEDEPEIRRPMKSKQWTSRVVVFAIACTTFPSHSVILAQETVTVHAVVTASTTRLSEGVFTVPRKRVAVDLGRQPQEVFGWMPLRGIRAGLQLALLIDDSSNGNFSPQLSDVESFIEALPQTTEIAVGYMQDGQANIAQSFSNDHQAAARALWAPMSGTGPVTSRYRCLSDLVKRWPGRNQDLRREVVIVTDGIDPYSGWASYCADDPHVQDTISDAQKSNIVVYSISLTAADPIRADGLPEREGQNYLIQVSNATGGKAYFPLFGHTVTVAPFLFDILCKLDNQYELSFVTAMGNTLQQLGVKTTDPNTRLRAPGHIVANDSTR